MTLSGCRVLVTRAEGQASRLAEKLAARGAEPWLLPAIEIVPATNLAPLHRALRDLGRFDWIVFTSANAVRTFLQQVELLGVSLQLPHTKIAAIGPATSEALECGWRGPDLVPKRSLSPEVVLAMGDVRGLRILLPQGDLASQDTPRRLTELGAEVTVVEAYRTVAAAWPPILDGRPDVITFTSSSCVLATHERLAERGQLDWLSSVPIACIGPVTAGTVEDLGGSPAEVATESTLDGLVAAVETIMARKNSHV